MLGEAEDRMHETGVQMREAEGVYETGIQMYEIGIQMCEAVGQM